MSKSILSLKDLGRVLETHLDIAELDSDSLAESFCNYAGSTEFTLFDGPKDLKAFDRLARGLTDLNADALGQMSASARDLLSMRLNFGPSDETERMEEFRSHSNGRHSRAFSEITSLAAEVQEIVEFVRREIEASPRKRRTTKLIETKRLQIVGVSADFWRRFNSSDVPKSKMRTEQPFLLFLEKVFFCFDIKTSPVKAHESWLKQTADHPPQAK